MSSRTRIFLVLALALVFCFVLAGVAVAAPAVTVNADGETYTCSMKDDVSFTFDITGINLVAGCFTDPARPAVLTVNFPAGFDLTPAQGLSVPIKIYVDTVGWFYAQPTPVINVGNRTATITVPILPIPTPNSKYVTRIIVGDDKQDLKADIACFNDGNQTIQVTVDTKCAAPTIIDGSIYVYDVPYSIQGVTITPDPILACATITVKGRVYDCKGADWPCKDVNVFICGDSNCTDPTCTPLIGPVTVVTDGFGNFEAIIDTPACAGDYNVYVTAGTAECGVTITDCKEITVNAKAPAKLQWYKYNSAVPGGWEPICDTTQLFKDCNQLKVELRDNCPCPNPCNDGNVATADKDYVIDLTGIVQGSAPPIVGVHFFANGNDCGNDTPQINSVTIAEGGSEVEVWAKPIVDGNVVIEGRNLSLTPDSFVAHVGIAAVNEVKLELKTKLVEDVIRAGWPVQGSVWLDPDWCAACGSDNFTVMVEFRNVSGLTATWDTVLKTVYHSTGANSSGATYLHKNAQAPGNPCKSHFYIYTTDFKIPDGCVPNTPIGSLEVRVKVTCDNTQVTYVTDWQTVSLINPVELKRTLDADTWQVLSTPKYLAGPGGADGNLTDLLGNNWSVAYCYLNGTWYNITTSSVKPLQAYYVKTKQRAAYDDGDSYTANYVFKRYTSPSETIPRELNLLAGWSNVGVSEPVNSPNGSSLCIQPEFAYRYVVPLCKFCKKIVNPGLGNKAEFSVLAITDDIASLNDNDPNESVYNGDAYWLWVDGAAKLVAEAIPGLIDP